jgi:hypothetical protein
MNQQSQHINTLQDIKQMMERSSRFISLSGLSGIAAGTCALVGAWFAYQVIHAPYPVDVLVYNEIQRGTRYASQLSVKDYMGSKLLWIAAGTFIAAFVLSFAFTYLRSKKTNTPLWGTTAKRLAFNVCIPMAVGGIYLLKLMQSGSYGLIAPGCLIFYGLALLNGSKYTLGEIRYLGFGQIALGILNLWYIGYGIYFWAAGFGLLHIAYGIVMWYKYERANAEG